MHSKLLTAAVLSTAMLLATEGRTETLVIGLDISLSVPLIANQDYANWAAGRVHERVGKLNMGDQLRVRTFGSSATTENLRRYDVSISRRNRAADVANTVAAIIRSIPRMVKDGKMTAQNETDLIAFLESQAKGLDCKAQPAEIVLLTDGLQHSAEVNSDRLKTGKARLPNPAKGLLEACRLSVIGLGQMANGASGVITKRLEAEWDRWSKLAGARFERVPD